MPQYISPLMANNMLDLDEEMLTKNPSMVDENSFA
jgi:hypothetical protein